MNSNKKANFRELKIDLNGQKYPIFVEFRPKSSRLIVKLVDDYILVQTGLVLTDEVLIRSVRNSKYFNKIINILPLRQVLHFSESFFYLFGKKNYFSLIKTKNKLYLQSQFAIFSLGRPKNIEAKIEKLLMKHFEDYLIQRTNFWTKTLEVPDYIVKLSRKNTSWGTNYYRQKIHYSKYLFAFSKEIIDYVIVHEVVHHFFRNHGKLFWEKIGKIIPNYTDLVKKLTNYELN
ncbi:YgjP-like metallopeptidase domain-containing protein [Mesomycoplasma ovipneumoniae]|uniref:YgjP-like metallopeptidase domain-containing protein n=1 Tax=Mesomycoplasma ovipneumoniae TaxID=29562 RepID=UPI003080B7D5